jgi:hypothetical protein
MADKGRHIDRGSYLLSKKERNNKGMVTKRKNRCMKTWGETPRGGFPFSINVKWQEIDKGMEREREREVCRKGK